MSLLRSAATPAPPAGSAAFAQLAQASPTGLLCVDRAWRCLLVNASAAQVVGRRPEDLRGLPWTNFAADKDLLRLVDTLEEACASGQPVTVGHDIASFYRPEASVELTILRMSDDHHGLPRFAVSVADVSTRRKVERDLESRATMDPLTGLANRRSVLNHVDAAIARRRDGEAVVVAFVDLDGFKPINDVFGHDVGDQLLVALARRLGGAVGDDEMIGRVGGDEFVACAGPGPVDTTGLAHRILRSLADPIPVGKGQDAHVGGSVGVAIADDTTGDIDADELVRRADAAMFAAKKRGGGNFEMYGPAHGSGLTQPNVEHDLERALADGELFLHYQPIIEVSSGRVVGVESLIRWYHPVNGVMYPKEFLPVAEKIGCQRLLTDFVLDQALRQAADWHARLGDGAPIVSVNLGLADLADPGLSSRIAQALDTAGLPSSSINVDIGEAAFATVGDGLATLVRDLCEQGLSVAIDDYGLGQSSTFDRLVQLPFTTLKLNPGFLFGLADDLRAQAVVGGLIQLAHGLDMTVVAEGVERTEDLEALTKVGCDLSQGFLHGRPVAADDLAFAGARRRSLAGRLARRLAAGPGPRP